MSSYREAYGDDHPNVAIRVNNIGSVLFARGDKAGAARCYTEAFGILLRAHGPRGQNVVTAAFNLTTVEVDPFPIAEEVGGPEIAAELRVAIDEERARRQGKA